MTEERSKDPKIEAFWNWFAEHHHRYHQPEDAKALVEMLDNQVLQFGLFTWEIGQGKERPFYLQISPNGDEEGLVVSRRIMAGAPDIPDWEFHYAKQALPHWDFTFDVHDTSMELRKIDARKWDFVLGTIPGEGLELILSIGNLDMLDEDGKIQAIDRVLNYILGEEVNITFIRSVEIQPFFGPIHAAKSKPLAHLKTMVKEQLKEVLGGE